MLDAWIIEQIKKEEEKTHEHRDQPHAQIDLPVDYEERTRKEDRDKSDRGVTIVDYTV